MRSHSSWQPPLRIRPSLTPLPFLLVPPSSRLLFLLSPLVMPLFKNPWGPQYAGVTGRLRKMWELAIHPGHYPFMVRTAPASKARTIKHARSSKPVRTRLETEQRRLGSSGEPRCRPFAVARSLTIRSGALQFCLLFRSAVCRRSSSSRPSPSRVSARARIVARRLRRRSRFVERLLTRFLLVGCFFDSQTRTLLSRVSLRMHATADERSTEAGDAPFHCLLHHRCSSRSAHSRTSETDQQRDFPRPSFDHVCSSDAA